MKPVCVCERERWREGEGERGVLCCINRKSLLKHVSTPASYTTTQSYDCHVEWNQTYLFILAMILIRISWHRVTQCTTLLHTQIHVPKPLRTEVLHTTHTESCNWPNGTEIRRSASRDRREINRDDWRVTPSSDYKPQGVVCWTGAPIPKALYHTLCWLYCQWYTHNYMLASSEPKTIIALALTLKWTIHANAGRKNSVKIHWISLAKLQQLLSGLFK